MPQLDSSTYLGQVTWFAVVFLGFYRIVLTDVLPRLNRALKVRAKKLERTRDDAREFDTERTASEQSYSAATASSSLGSYSLLTSSQDAQKQWLAKQVWALSNTHGSLSPAHASYLDSLVRNDASVSVLRQAMTQTTLADADLGLDSPEIK